MRRFACGRCAIFTHPPQPSPAAGFALRGRGQTGGILAMADFCLFVVRLHTLNDQPAFTRYSLMAGQDPPYRCNIRCAIGTSQPFAAAFRHFFAVSVIELGLLHVVFVDAVNA